ncbi:ScbR family autoregulator-binding transcription factor [Streptomyces sp. MK7]|uniref:ScbR family autoregulator-binding transcription factor n=1 Tax=Streptomyces sp. MK7 TaxID=3067635 RepID=UPI00292F93F3|nr:ScbR family autoregulator-binding transcription factor [Streptomyces sp. MK7]
MVKQERAARTREALINAAAEVFDRGSFAEASLATISSLAGVSSGALHFHFATKALLADAVQDAALRRLDIITAQSVAVPRPSLQSLVDASHDLMRALGTDAVLRAGFGLSATSAWPPEQNLRGRWQSWVTQAIELADRRGELSRKVAPEYAMTAVVAAMVGFEVLGGTAPHWRSRPVITRFWDLLLPGIAAPAVLGGLVPAGRQPHDAMRVPE